MYIWIVANQNYLHLINIYRHNKLSSSSYSISETVSVANIFHSPRTND